ncbi:MAG: hypothetical protein QM504_09305 [Pseudomonadota bacterium]
MLSRKKSIITFILTAIIIMASISQANSTPSSNSGNVKTMTIAEIYANKASLKGKMVRVRGKVVKVSRHIMKRNWIHIKDGTGEKGTDKIIFRSKDQIAKVDSEVIAQGVVDTDLDFGYGYTYSILVEDSTFSK